MGFWKGKHRKNNKAAFRLTVAVLVATKLLAHDAAAAVLVLFAYQRKSAQPRAGCQNAGYQELRGNTQCVPSPSR